MLFDDKACYTGFCLHSSHIIYSQGATDQASELSVAIASYGLLYFLVQHLFAYGHNL